jgi:fatty acid desaturase
MTQKDPDLKFIAQFPLTVRKLYLQFVPDLIGVSWLYLNLYYLNYARKNKLSVSTVLLSLLPGVVLHISMIAFCISMGKGWFYWLFWFLPMVTLVPLFMHIRGICEHAGRECSRDAFKGARTIKSSVATLMIAPHSYNFHVEHHLVSNIPHYNIRKFHHLISQQGLCEKPAYAGSYTKALKELTH